MSKAEERFKFKNMKRLVHVPVEDLNVGPDTTENVEELNEEETPADADSGRGGCGFDALEFEDDPMSDFGRILERMRETHKRKNNDYGDAAHEGYKELGMSYYLGVIFNKYKRLKSLTVDNKDQLVFEETIDDTLLDLANYAVMALQSLHRND